MPAQDPLPIHRARRPLRIKPPHTNRSLHPSSPIATSPDPPHANRSLRSIPRQRTPSPHPSPPASAHRYPILDRAQFHLAQSLASAHPAQPDPPPADTLTPPIPPADRRLRQSPQPHNHLARSPVDKTPTPPSPPPAATSLRHPPPANTTLHPISRQQKSHCARSLAWPSDHRANPHQSLRRVGRTTAPSLSIPSHRSHRAGPPRMATPRPRRGAIPGSRLRRASCSAGRAPNKKEGQTNPLHPGEHSAHTGKTRRPISHWRHGQADKWLCPRRDHSPPEPGRKPRGHTGRSERRWTNSYPLGRTINPVPGPRMAPATAKASAVNAPPRRLHRELPHATRSPHSGHRRATGH
ncbi:hypothetical protein BYI23_E000720 (plasmid) [Burkholderia sp. YI23]|nr:hypothetical protein BYI23_E000720 [Burkholderia sp. YI23]